MNQRTLAPRVERASWPDEEYEALANRCSGIHGRESLAVRQMVRDAITARGIDPKCVQLADAIVSFQLVAESFALQGETRSLRWQFNTLTVVYGISAGINGSDPASDPAIWFFNIDRSQRNAIGTSNNQASLSGIDTAVGGEYHALQPMYGEYKVDWTGILTLDERAAFPVVIDRMIINLFGLELWQRNGPILGR